MIPRLDYFDIFGLGVVLALGLAACLLASVPDCVTEDDTNCHWNAQTMGNGLGTSFYDVGGVVFYTR